MVTDLVLRALFFVLSLYLVWATTIGNMTIGYRYALFTFYQMTENETLFNSFLANAFLGNAVAAGILQTCMLIFENYAKGSVSFYIAVINRESAMMVYIAGINLFDYFMIGGIIFTVILIIFKGSGRIRYGDIYAAQAAKKKGVKSKKVQDILSVKFSAKNEEEEDSDEEPFTSSSSTQNYTAIN